MLGASNAVVIDIVYGKPQVAYQGHVAQFRFKPRGEYGPDWLAVLQIVEVEDFRSWLIWIIGVLLSLDITTIARSVIGEPTKFILDVYILSNGFLNFDCNIFAFNLGSGFVVCLYLCIYIN